MKTRQSNKAFTLVELVMVIVIIGLLAAVVMPKFSDLKSDAQNAAESGTVAAVRSGIKLAYMRSMAQGIEQYPDVLDSAANEMASETNALFTDIIDEGVTDPNWKKTGNREYKYLPTGTVYGYDKNTGTFKPS